jgi:hypothetical protein
MMAKLLKQKRNTKLAAERIAGRRRGRVIVQKVFVFPAPRVQAAISQCVSICSQ